VPTPTRIEPLVLPTVYPMIQTWRQEPLRTQRPRSPLLYMMKTFHHQAVEEKEEEEEMCSV
jgi:hypothetical protein